MPVFLLANNLSITYDQTEGILERIVTKQGTSTKADLPRRYLRKRVYVIITKSEGEYERE
jgi:putative transposon-encoded protein